MGEAAEGEGGLDVVVPGEVLLGRIVEIDGAEDHLVAVEGVVERVVHGGGHATEGPSSAAI